MCIRDSFESEKPLVVSSPEPSDCTEDLDAPFILSMTSPSPVAEHAPPYDRQTRYVIYFFLYSAQVHVTNDMKLRL